MRVSMVLALVVCSSACGGGLEAPQLDGGGAGADADSQIEYRGVGIAAALDRVAILRSDPAAGTCAVLRLVTPVQSGELEITAPDDWQVDLAGVSEWSSECLTQPFLVADVLAASGTGSVSFTVPQGTFHPSVLTVDASIAFDIGAAPGWVPASVDFRATDLAVD